MSARHDARNRLIRHFKRTPVADLAEIQHVLDTTSRTTVFRTLSEIGYLTSYSHAGRYYTLEGIPHFDDDGLWMHGEALFSRYHTLRSTIVQLVQQASAGRTHAELQALLRLRVHDTLRELTKAKKIGRLQLERLFLYVSIEQEAARAQLAQRRCLLETSPPFEQLPATIVIEVLIEIIHSAKARADPSVLVARLDARGVVVTVGQVEEILHLHAIEKKTARCRSRRSRS